MPDYQEQLGLILEEAEHTVDQARNIFDSLASPYENNLVLFGAGNLGRKILSFLRKINIEPLAFSDNRESMWDKQIDGLAVLSPSDAANRYAHNAAFVITIFNSSVRCLDIQNQLKQMGCAHVLTFAHLAWKYEQEFLPYFFLDSPKNYYSHKNQIRAAFNLWADDFSRKEYLNQLRWRLLADFTLPIAAPFEDQYFPNDLLLTHKETTFVDCGAYTGDTLKIYLEKVKYSFDSIYAFEPDPINFQKLQYYVHTLPEEIQSRIHTYQSAVGEKFEIKHMDDSDLGNASSAIGESGGVTIECLALDKILPRNDSLYIKYDIEGFEREALTGTKEIIQTSSPNLAVCLYHRPNDLWDIPLLINEISCDYQILLRRYMGWESVCYALKSRR